MVCISPSHLATLCARIVYYAFVEGVSLSTLKQLLNVIKKLRPDALRALSALKPSLDRFHAIGVDRKPIVAWSPLIFEGFLSFCLGRAVEPRRRSRSSTR